MNKKLVVLFYVLFIIFGAFATGFAKINTDKFDFDNSLEKEKGVHLIGELLR